jgi:hypothetical protein
LADFLVCKLLALLNEQAKIAHREASAELALLIDSCDRGEVAFLHSIERLEKLLIVVDLREMFLVLVCELEGLDLLAKKLCELLLVVPDEAKRVALRE